MGLFTTHGSDLLQLSFSSSLYDGYKTVCDKYENFISTLKQEAIENFDAFGVLLNSYIGFKTWKSITLGWNFKL